MAIHIQLDNYQLVRDKTTEQPKYVGFNVLLETDEGVGTLTCDWRLQDGLLYPPWKRTGPRGFFTHTYVSETVARKIREQAVADLTLMKEDDPEILVLDLEDGWKPSVYSPTNFKRMMPTLYKEKYSEQAPPQVQGHKRALNKPSQAPAPLPSTIQLVKKFVPPDVNFVVDDVRVNWTEKDWEEFEEKKRMFIEGVA